MVDIIGCANAVGKTDKVVDRSKNIVFRNVFRGKLCCAFLRFFFDSVEIAAELFEHFKEERKHEIFFEVGFDICDINGKTIAPTSDDPKEYYYDLGELISYPHGAHYSKKRKKLTIIEDNDELYEDCLDIIDYLKK